MSYLNNLWSLLSEYWSWLLGIAGLSAFLSWIPGGGAAIAIITSALQFAASFFQSISPIINGMFSGLIWVWSNVVWPGLLDILDSWATIFTVLIAGTIGWFVFVTKYEVSNVQSQRQLAQCQSELTKLNRPQVTPREVDSELPWPFNWKF